MDEDIFEQFRETVPPSTLPPKTKEVPRDEEPTRPFAASSNPNRTYDYGKKEFETAQQPKTALEKWNEYNEALGTAMAQGMGFGFYDEYQALRPAIDEFVKSGFDIEKGKEAYAKELERVRKEQKAQEEAHPYLTEAGKITGSLPAMVAAPALKTLPYLSKVPQLASDVFYGGLFGGLTGAGEAEKDRLAAAKTGAAWGAGLTGAIGAAGKGLGYLYDKTLKPIGSAVYAWAKPEAAAEKRLINTLIQDQKDIAEGKLQGMDWDQWTRLRDNNEPVTIADLGGPRTKALIQDIVKNDPSKAEQLQRFFEDRFRTQYERIGNDIRYITGTEANAGKTSDQLLAEYELKRGPAYDKAYAQPNAQFMFDDELKQFAREAQQSKSMADAIKNGFKEASDDAALRKKPEVQPFSLKHWDYVRRELNKDPKTWQRAEELNNILDAKVPEYKEARGVVSSYFGEKNALSAGEKLAEKRVKIEDLQKLIRKMSPEELELFREGYASNLSNNVIKRLKENVDLNNAIYRNPAQKEQILAIFGPEGAAKIKDRMAIESIYQNTNKAFKIPASSYKDLLMWGLTGGGVAGYESGWDPTAMLGGAGAGALAKKAMMQASKEMAKKGIKFLNKESANILSDLLTSQDPADMRKAYDLLERNPQGRQALETFANAMQRAVALSASQQMQPTEQTPQHPPAPWEKEETKEHPPAPWERADGGRIPFAGSSDPKRMYNYGTQEFETVEDKPDTVTDKMIKARSKEKSDIPYLPAEGYLSDVKKFEGYEPKAKWDIRQHSVGYGSRAKYPGEEITREEAEKRFREEMMDAGARVNKFKFDIPEPWKAALTSLTYNAGSAWMNSGLGEAIKKGDWNKARDIFLTYNKAEGKVNKGLQARRIAEMDWLAKQPKTQVAETAPVLQSRPETDQVKLARMAAEASRPEPTDQQKLDQLVQETATVAPQKPKLSPEQEARFLEAIAGFMKGQQKLPQPVIPSLSAPEIPVKEVPVVMPYGKVKGGSVTDKMKRAKLSAQCWPGHEAIGTKTKRGKTVPNCVPVKKKHG